MTSLVNQGGTLGEVLTELGTLRLQTSEADSNLKLKTPTLRVQRASKQAPHTTCIKACFAGVQPDCRLIQAHACPRHKLSQWATGRMPGHAGPHRGQYASCTLKGCTTSAADATTAAAAVREHTALLELLSIAAAYTQLRLLSTRAIVAAAAAMQAGLHKANPCHAAEAAQTTQCLARGIVRPNKYTHIDNARGQSCITQDCLGSSNRQAKWNT